MAYNKMAILGKGQLSSLLIESSIDTNIKRFDLPIIDHCGNLLKKEICLLKKKTEDYNIISYETENLSTQLLENLGKSKFIYPNIEVLGITQDRLKEKNLFSLLSINTNIFAAIFKKKEVESIVNNITFPFLLKTRRFGYDGKGQFIIKSKKNIEDINFALYKNGFIAEEKVEFNYEISQISCRDKFGNIEFYSLATNYHKKGILRKTFIEIKKKGLKRQAKIFISRILFYFNYVGILTIEFFVNNKKLFANELAPRVHNSGHWTINGALTSQFRNHILSIIGYKIKSAKKLFHNILMLNLIEKDLAFKYFFSNAIFLKSYGKISKNNRKMGHIVIVGNISTVFKQWYKIMRNNIDNIACIKK